MTFQLCTSEGLTTYEMYTYMYIHESLHASKVQYLVGGGEGAPNCGMLPIPVIVP